VTTIVVFQHVLIEQIAERQIFEYKSPIVIMVTISCASGKCQRALEPDLDLDGCAGLVRPGDGVRSAGDRRDSARLKERAFIDLHHISRLA